MRNRGGAAGGIALAALTVLAAGLIGATPSPSGLRRGETAYVMYCAMCHGDLGYGDGPLAGDFTKTAHVTPLRLNDAERLNALGRKKVAEIVYDGGGHSGRSNLMPPWGEKLGRPLVEDVTDYLFTLPQHAAQARASRSALNRAYYAAPKGASASGRKLYVYYCALCHGLTGTGDGVYADTVFARHGVKPRDLTDRAYFATRKDKDIYTVIALGGMRTDRSPDMPTWDLQLTPAQMKDLVRYIRAISKTKPTP